jgi:hypothetical protein
MNAPLIRRYLQPSPTLRWHPWAPLVAVALLIALTFILGAQWGYAAAKRDPLISDRYGYAFLAQMELTSKFPARELARKAGALDSAVIRYVNAQRETPGAWQRLRSGAESWLFQGGRNSYVLPRQSIVDLAEFRLRELSGSASRWQVTSTYCNEMEYLPLTGMDLRAGWERAANAYTELLGRTISAEQLAPAVPNARCEPSRRTQ